MATIRERAALKRANAARKTATAARKKAFAGKTEERFGVQMFVLPGKAEQKKVRGLEDKAKKLEAALKKERAMAKAKPKKKPVKLAKRSTARKPRKR
jgi:hypothetical protein